RFGNQNRYGLMVLWRGAPLSRARGRCSQLSYPDPPLVGQVFQGGTASVPSHFSPCCGLGR
ncbi:MAG TPA: hypothetical protein VNY32_08210, partial [Candidatus Acidoferrales bacterium]|nr:hypothetical protein [Candidatus Acidoferrales bacterium]